MDRTAERQRQGWTLQYDKLTRLLTCSCGHKKRAVDDVHADRLMDLHDSAHRALAAQPVLP